jgi:hypothetical protein
MGVPPPIWMSGSVLVSSNPDENPELNPPSPLVPPLAMVAAVIVKLSLSTIAVME